MKSNFSFPTAPPAVPVSCIRKNLRLGEPQALRGKGSSFARGRRTSPSARPASTADLGNMDNVFDSAGSDKIRYIENYLPNLFSIRLAMFDTNTSIKLKAAILRGTTDTGSGEGDPTGIIEIIELLREQPSFTSEVVKQLKARIKDPNQITSCITMDLLNQCMESLGFEFQLDVTERILQRILKISISSDHHPRVQQKAAAYINIWANASGTDLRLVEFRYADAERLRKEDARQGAVVSSHCAITASGVN